MFLVVITELVCFLKYSTTHELFSFVWLILLRKCGESCSTEVVWNDDWSWHALCVTCMTLLFTEVLFFHVAVVPQTRSSCIATTPIDTPRTATTVPFTTIQPSALLPGRQVSSSDELSRPTTDATTAGHCGTEGQATSEQKKQTPRLLPADNFGLFSVHSFLYCSHHS